MKTKHDKNFKIALDYMPEIFNLVEIWTKMQELFGKYDIKFNIKRYGISETTLYTYLKKYCISIGKGQWERKQGVQNEITKII